MSHQAFLAALVDHGKVKQRIAQLDREGLRVTLGELVTYEFAQLLKEFPELCQRRDADGAFQPSGVDLSLALNIARKGVAHPVLRGADGLTLEQIAVAFKELSLKYFRGELTDADCEGGAVTVSDMSSFGVAQMIPPVRDPEGASLGICAPMMLGTPAFHVVYHCDARIADCATVAAMLKRLTARLEAQ